MERRKREDPGDREAVESAYRVYLRRCRAGEDLSFEGFCAEHAEIADELRDLREGTVDLDPNSPCFSSESVTVGISKDGQRRLGDYRIIREIGRGGMGAVFEAVQESLGRRVALKILPGTFALDPRRIERFLREARATAKIRHPNIVPVYDVGEVGGTHFYSMEFIDSSSLAQMISAAREEKKTSAKKTASPTSDPAYISSVVEHMAGLAEGVEEAHKLGLIHRDIKPSNILIDKSGRWVLVDFGLVHDDEAQTITRSGEMMGTLQYMSPEQVARRKVDKRSDVYSLGVTLYEALTRRPPFEGKSDHEIQNAILFKEPPSPRKLNPRLHRDLETILLHALEKDPDRRYPSAAEFAADLRRLLRLEPVRASPPSILRKLSRRFRKNRVAIVAGLVLFLVAVFGLILWGYRPEPRLTLTYQRQLSADSGLTTQPTVTPDGEWVAYTSSGSDGGHLDIWVQRVDGGKRQRLTTHPANDTEPAFSPDGKDIAFRSEREGGGIYIIPARGGAPRRFADGGLRPRYSPDGLWIVYWVAGGGSESWSGGHVYVASTAGGAPRELAPEVPGRSPVWSPNGQHVLFLGKHSDSGITDWWVCPVQGGTPRRTGAFEKLAQAGLQSSKYGLGLVREFIVPDTWIRRRGRNRVLFSASRSRGISSLWAVSLAPETLEVSGPPQPVTSGTAQESFPWVGESGKVVFGSVSWRVDLWGVSLMSDENTAPVEPQRLTDDPAAEANPYLSANRGKLFFSTARKGDYDVWVKDLIGTDETPVTEGPDDDKFPVSNSDGSEVVFCRETQQRVGAAYLQRLNASRPDKVLDYWCHFWDWRPGERSVLFVPMDGTPVRPKNMPSPVLSLDLDTRSVRVVLAHPDYRIYQSMFSPDGRWILFNAVPVRTSGNSRLFVVRYQEDGPIDFSRWIPVTDGSSWDDKPRWSSDGDSLYFLSRRDGFLCVWSQPLTPGATPVAGEPRHIIHLDSVRWSPANVALGDQEICVTEDQILLNAAELTGNIWMADLKEEY